MHTSGFAVVSLSQCDKLTLGETLPGSSGLRAQGDSDSNRSVCHSRHSEEIKVKSRTEGECRWLLARQPLSGRRGSQPLRWRLSGLSQEGPWGMRKSSEGVSPSLRPPPRSLPIAAELHTCLLQRVGKRVYGKAQDKSKNQREQLQTIPTWMSNANTHCLLRSRQTFNINNSWRKMAVTGG